MGKKSKSKSKQVQQLHGKSKEVDLQLDQRGDGMYSGTFRWTETKMFRTLPSFPSYLVPDLSHGWQSYLNTRENTTIKDSIEVNDTKKVLPLVDEARQDASFLDALSFPITLISILHQLKLCQQTLSELHIVVLGGTVKAEQRIYLQTEYWEEIGNFFPGIDTIHLWLTGLEIEQDKMKKSKSDKKLQVHLVRGSVGALFKKYSFDAACTVCIGYNTGFGNFIESQRYELLWSWWDDLSLLSKSGLPVIFTCANDYADVNGEFAVQSRLLGSKFLILPKQNGFSAASHLHESGQEETSWSRANSFYYVIQGCDNTRKQHVLPNSSKEQRQVMLNERLNEEYEWTCIDALGRSFYKGNILSVEQTKQVLEARGNNSESPAVDTQQARVYMTEDLLSRTRTVHFYLPGITTAAQLQLEISETQIQLSLQDNIHSLAPFQLPDNIQGQPYKARFQQKQKHLSIVFQKT